MRPRSGCSPRDVPKAELSAACGPRLPFLDAARADRLAESSSRSHRSPTRDLREVERCHARYSTAGRPSASATVDASQSTTKPPPFERDRPRPPRSPHAGAARRRGPWRGARRAARTRERHPPRSRPTPVLTLRQPMIASPMLTETWTSTCGAVRRLHLHEPAGHGRPVGGQPQLDGARRGGGEGAGRRRARAVVRLTPRRGRPLDRRLAARRRDAVAHEPEADHRGDARDRQEPAPVRPDRPGARELLEDRLLLVARPTHRREVHRRHGYGASRCWVQARVPGASMNSGSPPSGSISIRRSTTELSLVRIATTRRPSAVQPTHGE